MRSRPRTPASPPFAFWGRLNNTAFQSEVDRVEKTLPRRKARLLTWSPCPWLYDSLMVFRRIRPVQSAPRAVFSHAHLRSALEAERTRLDERTSRLTELRDRLVNSPWSVSRQPLTRLLEAHIRQAAAKVV